MVIELGVTHTARYSIDEAKATIRQYAFATSKLSTACGELATARFGYATYDCLPVAESPALSGIDALIAAGLNGRMDVKRAAGILAVGECVGEHIAALDRMGGCFWELDAHELGDLPSDGSAGHHLRSAWRILMDLEKVGVAVTHKTLHHKRPHWFPLLDGKTKVAYPRGRAWLGIHADLHRHAEQFSELERWFAEDEGTGAVHLTRLRLHDILLWCDRTNNRAVA